MGGFLKWRSSLEGGVLIFVSFGGVASSDAAPRCCLCIHVCVIRGERFE